LSGLWHGAMVNFIYWGILHGLYYLIEQAFFPVKKGRILPLWEKVVRWIFTMSVVSFGWLLFRIDQMRKVKLFFTSTLNSISEINFEYSIYIPLILFIFYELIIRKNRPDEFLANKSLIIRWTIYLLLFSFILLFANTGDLPFIYFQF
jgi:D-alanyl-lipoteichoic acid acyltransferase DltB (MBOAT superfamily)